jgi:hypothetical protein
MNENDAMLHLAGAMMMGASGYIEHQEKQGQVEVSHGGKLPINISGMSKEELEEIGFVFGEPIDELFQECVLPEGWQIAPTDHSMWSDILDEGGNKRGSMFYKAAFYDRDAFVSFTK